MSSTRVIKLACGPDIGRVVKIRKQAAAVFPPRRDRGDTSPPTSGAHPTSQHHHHRGGSSSLSSTTTPSSLSSSSSSLSSLYPSSTYHSSSSHVQQQNGSGGGGLGRSSTSSPSLGGQRTTSNAISPLPRSAASPSYPTASSISSNSSMTSSSSKLSFPFPILAFAGRKTGIRELELFPIRHSLPSSHCHPVTFTNSLYCVCNCSIERWIRQWFGFHGGSQSGFDEAAASRETHSHVGHSILQETRTRYSITQR